MPTAPFLAPERDEKAVVGRAKRAADTYFVVPGQNIATIATYTLTANTDTYSWWLVDTPVVVDQMMAEVTTAVGTNFRIGLYRADRDWQPIGAPLADSGNLSSASTGVKTYTPGTPVYIRRGRHVSVVNCDGAAALRAWRGGRMSAIDSAGGANSVLIAGEVGRAYAAFPTPGTVWTGEALSGAGPSHLVIYRLSAP